MGSSTTLVNIVNNIFSVAASAIDAVKNAATAVLEAVKDGLQFILDAVLGLILDAIELIFHKFISALTAIFLSLDPSIQITPLADDVKIGNNELRIFRKNLGLTLIFGSTSFEISEILTSPNLQVETLAATSDQIMLSTSIVQLLGTMSIIVGVSGGVLSAIAGLGAYLVSVLTHIIIVDEILTYIKGSDLLDNRNEFKSKMENFYGGLLVGLFISVMLGLGSSIFTVKAHETSSIGLKWLYTKMASMIGVVENLRTVFQIFSLVSVVANSLNLFNDENVSTDEFSGRAAISLLDFFVGQAFDIEGKLKFMMVMNDFVYIFFFGFLFLWLKGMTLTT